MSKDEVEIASSDNVLTIRGEKKQEEKRDEGAMHMWERSYGPFMLPFTLPCRAAEDQVAAEFKDC